MLAQSITEALRRIVLQEVSAAFARTFTMETQPKRSHKKMAANMPPPNLATGTKTMENPLMRALRQIADLKENSKLRSWRGREAVRIATEAIATEALRIHGK